MIIKPLTVLPLVLLLLTFSCSSTMKGGNTPSETHEFQIKGNVSYRCYAGYSGKKAYDNITKEVCDNNTYTKLVVDKILQIQIVDESDPEDSKELVGSWLETYEFRGRKFTAAFTLFKDPVNGYRIRLTATDNEPSPRTAAIYLETKAIKEMNPLSFELSSAGRKEEINFLVTLKPSF